MGRVTNEELQGQALALPPQDRARLAREIEHRVREAKGGSVKRVDWKDTRARIIERLTARNVVRADRSHGVASVEPLLESESRGAAHVPMWSQGRRSRTGEVRALARRQETAMTRSIPPPGEIVPLGRQIF